MSTATLLRQARLLRQKAELSRPAPSPILEAIRRDPAATMTMSGMQPDPWQESVLRSRALRQLLLCSRQAGKSSTAAALALNTAFLEPGSLTLLLSPTLRQSGELFREKVLRMWRKLGRPLMATRTTQLELQLSNGSRIVSLPENEEGIRGFSSVAMLIIDEASRVCDDLYRAVRPMLAVSGGRLVALSTPFGRRGWFFDEWERGSEWKRVRVTASQCPRISQKFLDAEEKALGERWFRQEYYCTFEESIDAVFAAADVQAALSGSIKPLFFGSKT